MKERVATYTKKVIEHFKKPHNYGRMKNPDGVGKVGNVVCVLPKENIHINSDLKAIDKISKENKVLSHNGLYNRMNRIVHRNYEGQIIKLKNKLGAINLTPNHLLLGIKILKGDKFLRTKNRKKMISGWYHAGEIKKEDIILYPILRKEKDLKYLKIDIPKSEWDFRSQEIPGKILINSGLLKLFGYFLSEGNVQDKPSRTFISFTLNIKEDDIAKEIKETSDDLFNLRVKIRKRPERKTLVVYLHSARLARFFKKLFNSGAENKSIPDFIMHLPPEKQKSLIYGLWKGDGYVNLERDGARAGYSTISYKLAQQMKVLLLRQKIAPSIYAEKEKEINGVKHKKSYRIHIGQRDSLLRLCSILNIKYAPSSYVSEKSWFDDNYLYLPITDIERRKYKGKVFNLEVRGSHSFTSEAFCLHNCGDVMWLYIKVGKSQKGKEFIKDIKFETFGCVAALATSSVITDLAKGKTIDDALKIERREIVKALGGLPPVKLHCSVLAADALYEAIYDYLSKDKREIPGKLQKKHEIIKKEKEIIEEKYKDWIETEEEMHRAV